MGKLTRPSHVHTSKDFPEVLFNFLLPRGSWGPVMMFYCFPRFFLGKDIPLKIAEQHHYDQVSGKWSKQNINDEEESLGRSTRHRTSERN